MPAIIHSHYQLTLRDYDWLTFSQRRIIELLLHASFVSGLNIMRQTPHDNYL